MAFVWSDAVYSTPRFVYALHRGVVFWPVHISMVLPIKEELMHVIKTWEQQAGNTI